MIKSVSSFFALVLGVIFLSLPGVAHADTNSFSFASFEADYYLSRDTENRSTLRVTEKLLAVFPDYDQNHGIERAIPNTYDGHSASPHIASVTKADGTPWPYTTYQSNDNTVIRIGSAETFVHGQQIYTINYTLRDVTKAYDDHDEFYWDTNGTQWQQPFATSISRLHVDTTLQPQLNGQTACYSGTEGSAAKDCSIISQETGDNETLIIVTSTKPLQAGENISMVVGFKPQTFAGYVAPPLSLMAKLFIFVIIPVFYLALPILILVWGVKKWRQFGRDRAEIHTIVPQYLPPKNTSMIRSDILIHTSMSPKAVSATIIDLAVRHYLKIYEVGKKEYELELVKSPQDLVTEDRDVIDLLFPDNQGVGTRIALKDKKNLYIKVASIGKEAYGATIQDKLMVDTRSIQKRMQWIGGSLMALSFITINPLLLIASLVTLISARYMPARTREGAELKAYLEGTKMYMEVAEAERLKMLQAPDTATKVDTNDTGQLVKLYERLLPLAMLYGIEKKWANQFATLYTQDNAPDWYAGNYSVFNAALFASAVSGFGTNIATTSFSPPTNSSSSGLSGGGGFSGGGGGGGGGGGW